MSLAQRLAEAKPKGQPGPLCGVTRTLLTLDQEDADALRTLLYERLDLNGFQVAEILADEGLDISQYVVNRHRLGRCSTCNRR